MPRLLDHFSDVISEVLRLAVKIPEAEAHLESAAAVRERLLNGVKVARATARAEVRAERDTTLAIEGVVAWIDEVMLGYPEWGTAVPNLQGELLNHQIARETFFENLEQLDDKQDEVRDVYHLLLCLGFQGYYGELSEGRKELERLTDTHGQRLNAPPLPPAKLTDDYLTIQPYGVTPPPKLRSKPAAAKPMPPPVIRDKTPWPWRLMLGLAMIPIVLLIAAGFLLMPGWLHGRVEERLANLECARLESAVGFGRIAKVGGFVSSEADRQIIRTELGEIFGLAGVEDEVTVFPPPFCKLLVDAWPLVLRNQHEKLGAAIGLADSSQPLRNRNLIVVNATAPTFDGYLYVFYVHSDGGIVPLLPNTMLENNQHGARENVALGEKDSPFLLQVAPPFGTDMLLLYATSEQLLSGPPTDYYGDLDILVDEIKKGLDAMNDAGGQMAASFSFIETKP